MEINTQQMEALLHLQEQQAQLPRKNNGSAAGFDNLLNRQLQQDAAILGNSPASSLAVQTDLYSQTLANVNPENENLDPDSAVLQAAFEQASGALTLFDDYSRALGKSGDSSLRDAWSVLEGIDSRLAQMRDHPARASNANLDAMLNELEIMATTEKFKFNRGDYF